MVVISWITATVGMWCLVETAWLGLPSPRIYQTVATINRSI